MDSSSNHSFPWENVSGISLLFNELSHNWSASASASLLEDGKHVAISNIDTGFNVYVLASGAPLCSFEHDVGDPRAVPVRFMHGGRAIVGGSVMGKVNVWDIALRKKIHILPIPGASYRHMSPRLPSSYTPISTREGPRYQRKSKYPL